MEEQRERHWSLDRRIPLALIVTIALQTAVFAFWLGTVSARLDTVEGMVQRSMSNADRLTRVEVKLETVGEVVQRIDRRLEGRQ